MANLFKDDVEAPLCFQSSTPLASHTWVSKNLSCSFPSSEVRNNAMKWSDGIDRLLPRQGAHWKKAGIYNAILRLAEQVHLPQPFLSSST
ncbi:unnamed protein product [Prunus armeniaca]